MPKVLTDAGWATFGSAGALDYAYVTGTFAGNGTNTVTGITAAHLLGKVPLWVGITAEGGNYGWETSPADASNLHLAFQSPLFVFSTGINYGYRCLAFG